MEWLFCICQSYQSNGPFFFGIDSDFLLKFIPLLDKSLNMYSWKKIYEKKSPMLKFGIPM